MKRFVWISLALLSIFTLAACGGIPVRDMSAAKHQVSSAEEEKASEYSPKNMTDARGALLKAQQDFVDESFGDAKSGAEKAREAAMKARAESAPKYTEEQKKAAADAITEAEEAYAEELAKDDFEAAKKLYADAGPLHTASTDAMKQAQAKPEGAERQMASAGALQSYQQTYRKYQAAKNAATKARNTALAQKEDLMASLNGVEATLARVESYGGKDTPEYQAARRELDDARAAFQAGKLKAGNQKLVKAEGLAAQAVSASVAKKAEERLAEAKKAVEGANQRYESVKSVKPKDNKAKADMKALGQHMAAAKEALASADDNYKTKKFDESVKESDQAIRLAAIVQEKSEGFAGNITKREIPGKNDPNMNFSVRLPEGYSVYVVKVRQPITDCLWLIAKEKYGDLNKWHRIHKANKPQLKDPNFIYPGQELAIPPATGDVQEIDIKALRKEQAPKTDGTEKQPSEKAK